MSLPFRIGHGYDVHKFGGDKPLILGGVEVAHTTGLLAHSDGDVVLHALCDALLGAVALGDIGHHFPDSDPAFAGANSGVLLRDVYSQVKQRGYILGNTDITIVAQAPKMAPYIPSMQAYIAHTLEVEPSQVNVKATTTEKLGFTGRKEGIATHAVVLLIQAED
ncbi:2-C-methyl-D-erythritol 2,4-cyclodiphosphate synthase [Alteromonas sp. LMIT006]|jgi:2-C-methyl-D-erythritol 2,4-cyclodiphosphate synthase|uniref:2-C-methyl-D-erythritol 2,4-cyclodiphosphate synthase n=1 Tax=Alteromonadaceae TaxID=72275 RepID=UPI0020CA6A0A|nr:2-C-methyl-D-erythritol 2,4-cyclodiphosphate synthase [Alteromonas sp. LMIT006]UTP73582.1 2-C-methyl-D-erythritol 2,4-cyclodiphosphate synthase [Alteromonas sp. LMIT006]